MQLHFLGRTIMHQPYGPIGAHGSRPKWPLLIVVVAACAMALATTLALFSFVSDSLTKSQSIETYEVFLGKLDSRRAGAFSTPELRQLISAASSFGEVAAYSPLPVTLSGGDAKHPTPAAFVTGSYFHVASLRFLLGKEFDCVDGEPLQACRQVILGSRIWQTLFSSDPAIVGRNIVLNGESFAVSGVASDDAQTVDIGSQPLLWISWLGEPDLLGADWINHGPSVCWLFPVIKIRDSVQRKSAARDVGRALKEGRQTILLLTPAEVRLARTFRIRGSVIAAMRAYIRIVFWCLLSIGAFGFALLVRRISPAITLRAAALITGLLGAGTVMLELLVQKAVSTFVVLFGSRIGFHHAQIDWMSVTYIMLLSFGGIFVLRILPKHGNYGVEAANKPSRSDETSLRTGEGIRHFLDAHSYTILCGLLLALFISYSVNGLWVSDYWEHSAVVHELAANPIAPSHPILSLKAPHAGFNPYALTLGLLCRWTGLSVVDILTLAGLLNLLLLMYSVKVFIRDNFTAKHTDVYALLFMLTVWGFFPFMMSGFLHLNVLIASTSYPATFATGITFLLWFLYARLLRNNSYTLMAATIGCLLLVILDHPITAVSAMVGLFALTVGLEFSWKGVAWMVCILSAALLAANFWPYYSLFKLFASDSGQFDTATSYMYPGYVPTGEFVRMIFLGAVGIPFIWRRLQKNPRDFLSVLFICLTLIYIGADITGKLTLGRVLSFMMVALQITLADWIATHECSFHRSSQPFLVRSGTAAIVCASLLGLLMVAPGIISATPVFQNSYGEYEFLRSNVGHYATVLADMYSSLKVPTFAGKVVAYPSDHVQFFVDSRARQEDVQTFFSADTGFRERRAILAKYRVDFVLLNENKVYNWVQIVRSLQGIATVQYADGEMLLLKITT